MRKSRFVTSRIVGMAVLLMVVTALGIRADDGNSSVGDSTSSPAVSTARPSANANDEIKLLKQQMALQQQQMAFQQKQIEQMVKAMEEQKRLLEQLTKPGPTTEQAAQPAKPGVSTGQASRPQVTSLGEVASTRPMIPPAQRRLDNAIAPIGGGSISSASINKAGGAKDDTSPLQIRIGDATLTPVGFMDFTSVFRSKTAGGNIGTSFGSIPYASIAAGGITPYQVNLSEFRLSMQNSRIGFRADADVHGAHVMGYMEADFLGTPASTNIAVTSNSNLLRSRLYWVDFRRGAWEVLGGQTWSLLTPGRVGVSPLPSDIFYSQVIDVNYQAGLFWGRIPELRFVYHPSKRVALAFAVDSPDQYAGGSAGGGTITLPAALATPYAGELDFGASSGGIATPNIAPDFIAKLAFDPNKRVHFEIGGVERNFKVYNPNSLVNYTKEGGGGFVNLHVEPIKGVRLVTNNFWSDGGGRYIFGQAPDLIAHADGNISLVHSGSTVSGIEITQKKSLLYAYYGGIYIMRNTAFDANGTTPIGYGYSGSGSGQNRAIQEITFGFNQTVWKDAKWGAVNFMGQYSYLVRNPWFVNFATGQPVNANNNLVFFNLRYTLPGSAPTMGK